MVMLWDHSFSCYIQDWCVDTSIKAFLWPRDWLMKVIAILYLFFGLGEFDLICWLIYFLQTFAEPCKEFSCRHSLMQHQFILQYWVQCGSWFSIWCGSWLWFDINHDPYNYDLRWFSEIYSYLLWVYDYMCWPRAGLSSPLNVNFLLFVFIVSIEACKFYVTAISLKEL